MKHFLFVFGTRPEAIKLFPLARVLRARGARVTLLATAQHTDMMADVVDAFGISPDLTLSPLPKGRTLTELIRQILAMLPRYLTSLTPDAIVVQGDTASAFAGALVGFLSGVRVIHIEAGLRTYDTTSPFPEEAFRRAIATFASVHFAPSEYAHAHLLAEGVSGEIYTVGNTVLDALAALCPPRCPTANPYAILTTHRRESAGEGREAIFRAVRRLAARYRDFSFIYPVHKSESIAALAEQMLGGVPNITLSPPVPPDAFYRLLAGARLILTDSGGLSEEGAALGIPTFVLREKTEREAELLTGRLTLVGTDEERIYRAVSAQIESCCSPLTAQTSENEKIPMASCDAIGQSDSPSEKIADIILEDSKELQTYEQSYPMRDGDAFLRL